MKNTTKEFLAELSDEEVLYILSKIVFKDVEHPGIRAIDIIKEKNNKRNSQARGLFGKDRGIVIRALQEIELENFNGIGAEKDFVQLIEDSKREDEACKAKRLDMAKRIRAKLDAEKSEKEKQLAFA